ncbi:MAG: aldehyde dehydrogenase [Anaerocolumna sp.]|jgi:aldehyde dehydrogenase (NAD+)|nr:aldehyde dehydrogenase [Anaerocolumna sp.]
MNIEEVVRKQRKFFRLGKTRDASYRIAALIRLKEAIITSEDKIINALKADLNKSRLEAYMTEIGMVLEEINNTIGLVKKYTKREYVKTPLAQFPSTSFTVSEPYGVVLIMAPWNYPFQLSISPLIGAIAAGNCAVVKPSEYAPHTAEIIEELIKKCFPSGFVKVVNGDSEVSKYLLDQKFDYIFFTGGGSVGRIVMEKAAKNLTPVTLELGGKSPCIVEKSSDVRLAAKRIVFGKFINAGQTCVAPDYIYVHQDIKDELIHYIKYYIRTFYGMNPMENESYPKIINEKHCNRLLGLLKNETIIMGGRSSHGKLEPTLTDTSSWEGMIMKEEIFGPILPILTYTNLKEVVQVILDNPKPLALYLFTKNKKVEDYVLKNISFGGGCINDTIVHLATPYMGFGGVGGSGMGQYHGKFSLDTFSHKKSILKKSNWLDLPMRYYPYNSIKEKMIRFFLH